MQVTDAHVSSFFSGRAAAGDAGPASKLRKRSLSNTLGAAFGLEGVIFDPHQNKGLGPAGAIFTASLADTNCWCNFSIFRLLVQTFYFRHLHVPLHQGPPRGHD